MKANLPILSHVNFIEGTPHLMHHTHTSPDSPGAMHGSGQGLPC